MKSFFMRLLILLFVLMFISSEYSSGQSHLSSKRFFVSGGIQTGLTLKAKMNYGFFISCGYETQSSSAFSYGISFSWYAVKVKDMTHKCRSLGLLFQNDYVAARLGPGRMKNGWGYVDRNRCIVKGFAAEIKTRLPHEVSPVLGYTFFLYNRRDWAWFEHSYHSFFAGAEYTKSHVH